MMIHVLSDFLIYIFLLGRILSVKCPVWDRTSHCNCEIFGLGRMVLNLISFKIQGFFLKVGWVPAPLHFHNYCPHTWQTIPKISLTAQAGKHWSTRKVVRFGAGERKGAARKRVRMKWWAAPPCPSPGTVTAKPKGLLLALLCSMD